jgi:hypothetical protein
MLNCMLWVRVNPVDHPDDPGERGNPVHNAVAGLQLEHAPSGSLVTASCGSAHANGRAVVYISAPANP